MFSCKIIRFHARKLQICAMPLNHLCTKFLMECRAKSSEWALMSIWLILVRSAWRSWSNTLRAKWNLISPRLPCERRRPSGLECRITLLSGWQKTRRASEREGDGCKLVRKETKRLGLSDANLLSSLWAVILDLTPPDEVCLCNYSVRSYSASSPACSRPSV